MNENLPNLYFEAISSPLPPGYNFKQPGLISIPIQYQLVQFIQHNLYISKH